MVLDGIRASKLLLKGTLEMFGGTEISHSAVTSYLDTAVVLQGITPAWFRTVSSH